MNKEWMKMISQYSKNMVNISVDLNIGSIVATIYPFHNFFCFYFKYYLLSTILIDGIILIVYVLWQNEWVSQLDGFINKPEFDLLRFRWRRGQPRVLVSRTTMPPSISHLFLSSALGVGLCQRGRLYTVRFVF